MRSEAIVPNSSFLTIVRSMVSFKRDGVYYYVSK